MAEQTLNFEKPVTVRVEVFGAREHGEPLWLVYNHRVRAVTTRVAEDNRVEVILETEGPVDEESVLCLDPAAPKG